MSMITIDEKDLALLEWKNGVLKEMCRCLYRDMPTTMTKQQAANYLGCSVRTIERRIEDGTLKQVGTLGRATRVDSFQVIHLRKSMEKD